MEHHSEALLEFVREGAERRTGALPPFPSVAVRLVHVVNDGEVELRKIEQLVAQDPVTSAYVLRAANSALYPGAVRVDTLAKAISRLGLRETAQVAMRAAAQILFSMEDRAELALLPELRKALWFDALVSSYGGRLLAGELKIANSEHVFLGALFRDLGSVIVLKVIASGLVQGQLGWRPSGEEVAPVLQALRAELGVEYMRRSNLPHYVADIAERYASPTLPFAVETAQHHVVRFAAGICDKLGIAPFARRELGPLAEESMGYFSGAAERLEYFELQFQELADQLQDLV